MAFLWSSFWFLSLQFFLAIMHWLESPVVLSRSSDSKDLDDEEKAFSVVPVIRHPVGFFVCRLSECKCCIMFMREIGIFYTICGSHSNEMVRIYLFFFFFNVLWKTFCKLRLISSLTVWWNSLVKPPGPGFRVCSPANGNIE